MNPDNSVQAISTETLTAQVVFTATNRVTGVTGRDTISVVALAPDLAVKPLKEFPAISIAAGPFHRTSASISARAASSVEYYCGGESFFRKM